VQDGGGEVDPGVPGVIGFLDIDGDLEVVVAEILTHAVAVEGAQGELYVIYLVVVKGGKDGS
jgi:hypothetical protein